MAFSVPKKISRLFFYCFILYSPISLGFFGDLSGINIVSSLFETFDEGSSKESCSAGCVSKDDKKSFYQGVKCIVQHPYQTPCADAFQGKVKEILGGRLAQGTFYNLFQSLPGATRTKLHLFLTRIKSNTDKNLTLDLEILRNALDDSLLKSEEIPEKGLELLKKKGFKAPIALAKVYYIIEGQGFFGQILETKSDFSFIDAHLYVAKGTTRIKPGDWIVIYNFEWTRPWKSTRFDAENPFLNRDFLKVEKKYNLENLISLYVTSYEKIS